MSIEEKILNDNSCSPYVDKGRGYVEIAFKDGAYWGYEKGCKDMIEKACEWLYVYYPTLERSKSAEDAWDKFKKAMEE
jgi:hypothetical protein